MTFQRTPTRVAVAVALLATAMATEATPVTVDFTVTSNDVSNPSYGSGTTGSGYFTFDDALIPSGGNGLVGNPILGLPTLDLFFSWFGVSFDESNAKIATLSFADGVLTDWMIGGSYLPASCGFLRYACTSSGGAQPDFDGLGSGGIGLTDATRQGLAYGRVQWSVRDTAVPSPARWRCSVSAPGARLRVPPACVGARLRLAMKLYFIRPPRPADRLRCLPPITVSRSSTRSSISLPASTCSRRSVRSTRIRRYRCSRTASSV